MPYRDYKVVLAEKVVNKEPAELLLPHLKQLLNDMGLLDEIHLWDYGKNEGVKSWLRALGAEEIVKPASVKHRIVHDPSVLNLQIRQNGLEFEIDTRLVPDNQANVLISLFDVKVHYSLDVGIKGRAKWSRFRNETENMEKFTKSILLVPGAKHSLSLTSTRKRVTLKIDDYVWSWPGNLTITAVDDDLEDMNTLQLYIPVAKTDFWYFYYQRRATTFKDAIVIFADSEILSITTDNFQSFLDCRIDNPEDLIHANTINNDVTAYYQQKVHGLIPQTLMDIPAPGDAPVLSVSSTLCRSLHQLYTSNLDAFSYPGTECVKANVPILPDFTALMANQLQILRPLTEASDVSESTVLTLDSGLVNIIHNMFVACKFVCSGQFESMTEGTASAILDLYKLGSTPQSIGYAPLTLDTPRQIMTLRQWLEKNQPQTLAEIQTGLPMY